MECPPLVLDLLPDGRTDEVDGVGYVEIGEEWAHMDMHGFGFYAFSQGWDPRAASRYFREVAVLMPIGDSWFRCRKKTKVLVFKRKVLRTVRLYAADRPHPEQTPVLGAPPGL